MTFQVIMDWNDTGYREWKFLGIMSSPFSPKSLQEPVSRLMDSHVSLSPPLNSLYIVSVIVGTSDIKWVKGRRKEKLTPVTFCILLRAPLEKRLKQTPKTFKNKHGLQLTSVKYCSGCHREQGISPPPISCSGSRWDGGSHWRRSATRPRKTSQNGQSPPNE